MEDVMATRLNTLKQQRIEAKASAEKLVDGHLEVCTKEARGFTSEEKAEHVAVEQRVEQLDELITAEERRLERVTAEAAAAEAVDPREAKPGAPAIVKAINDRDRFKTFGEQMAAVQHAARPGATPDPRLFAASGLNEGVPSEGGYLVQQEFSNTIWERTYNVGELIKRAFRIPLSGNSNGIKIPAVDEISRADGSRYGGVQVFWTEEGGLKTASKPAFRQMDLKLKKVAGVVYVSDELISDSAALEAFLMRILPTELNFAVENSFVNGSGAGQPLGYMNSGAVISVTRAVANQIAYEDVLNMWSRMWAPSRPTSIWLVSQSTEPQLYTMSLAVGTGGAPVYLPAGGASVAPYANLFGRPVIPSEYTANLGTAGDIQLVDMNEYVYIEKGGIKSDSSMHVRFLYDEMTFRFVYRVDGQPAWNSPITPKNGGSTLSPFVILAT